MSIMAEVSRSPFDLRSWLGLTAVLKAARESSLSPVEYANFRNLVLEYAQKGGDAAIKKQIDAVIQTFSSHEKSNPGNQLKEAPLQASVSSGPSSFDRSQGRRVTPVFKTSSVPHQESKTEMPVVIPTRLKITESTDEPIVSIGRDPVVQKIEPVADLPVEIVEVKIKEEPLLPATFKTIDEHRIRITEIKRRVNALVGNPVTLMDKGNGVGRTYMTALLTALKASSPGATMNIEDAMENLEKAFQEIIAFNKNQTTTTTEIESEIPLDTPPPVSVANENIVEQTSPVSDSDLPGALPPLPTLSPFEVEVPIEEDAVPKAPLVQGDERWDQDDQEDTKEDIREIKKMLHENQIPIRATDRGRRSFIPSLIDMEDDKVNTPTPEDSAWHAHIVPDELSHESVMRRPTSSISGLTVGTPQTELMVPEVSAALSQMLHDWNIFASSGLFGMGPGGIEHPLFQQLAHLPMGEVLSGRWDGANPKIARAIKDYVDAWRHEQGVAYNPTEAFEHYLRRVAQRIMKRQNGEV